MITSFLFVGLGGFIGSIIRYAVAQWSKSFSNLYIPIATLTVNSIGSLLLGVFIHTSLINPNIYSFFGIGLCGSLTTFSTFIWETLDLLLNKELKKAVVYTVVQVVICFIFVAIGYHLQF